MYKNFKSISILILITLVFNMFPTSLMLAIPVTSAETEVAEPVDTLDLAGTTHRLFTYEELNPFLTSLELTPTPTEIPEGVSVNALTVSTYDTETSAASIYAQSMYSKGFIPGTQSAKIEDESISPATGNLTITNTDLVLKGRNGLDLSLTRYYSSFESNLYESSPEFKSPLTINERRFDIGEGWAFDFPYIEARGNSTEEVSGDTLDTSTLIMHFGRYGVWQLKKDSLGNYSIINYNLKDMSISVDQTFTYDNRTSYLVLTQKDGKKYYFSNNKSDEKFVKGFGLLLGIRDRFGNTIKFKYTKRQFSDTYASYYNLFISSITDSCDRVINFTYNPNNVCVSVSDGTNTKTISYNKEQITDSGVLSISPNKNIKEYMLSSVTNEGGFITTYNYELNRSNAAFNDRHYNNYYTCLNKITYPTGGYRSYSYLDAPKYFGSDGVMFFYKVSSRYDYDTLKSKKFNIKTYAYLVEKKCCEYDGYGSVGYYYYPKDSSNPQAIYFLMTDVTTTTSEGVTFTTRYNYNKDLLLKNIYEKYADSYINNYYTYNYDNLIAGTVSPKRTLCSIWTTEYSSSYTQKNDSTTYLQKLEQFTYDDYNNLTKYDSTFGPTYNFTYDTDYYHLLKSKKYKRDYATVIEVYNPSSDHKTISDMSITDEDTLKKKASYTYDTYGNITAENNYYTASDYTTVNYTYTANSAYISKKYTDGVTDADGNLLGTIGENYYYDYFGNLTKKTDANNNSTLYEYDALNRVVRQTNPDSTIKTWVYTSNTSENTLIATDENYNNSNYTSYGSIFKTTFDTLGNVVKQTDVLSNTDIKAVEYYPTGAVKGETDKNGTVTSYVYEDRGRLKSKTVTDSQNVKLYSESYNYSLANGVDDTKSNFTVRFYTKISKTVSGTPSITTNTYINRLGILQMAERVYSGGSYYEQYRLDSLGNKVLVYRPRYFAENNKGSRVDYECDCMGKVLKEANSSDGTYCTTTYDLLGRVTAKTDFKGNTSTFTYDKLGRLIVETVPLTGTLNTVKKHYYDNAGNITFEKISNKSSDDYNITKFEYDKRNRLSQVISYDNNNPAGYTQYYYDATGNKLRMYTGLSKPLSISGLDTVYTNGDTSYSVTKYSFDQFGRIKSITDPLSNIETYTYDVKDGCNVKTLKVDRNGNTETTTCDGLGRVLSTSVTAKDGITNKGYYNYSYQLTGNRTSMTGNNLNVNYTYDDLGRLITETDSVNGIVKSYTYDAEDNRKTFTVKQNDSVKISNSYTYDCYNRLTNVASNGVNLATYGYDTNGNRASLTYANGNTTSYTYNSGNKVTSLVNKSGASTVSQYDYTYYLNGSQASKADSQTGKTTNYAYDGLGRLTSESDSSSSIGYTYDDYSNRKSMTYGSGASVNYTYDANNRLTLETKFENNVEYDSKYLYDNNGNMIYTCTDTIKDFASSDEGSISVSVVGEDGDSTAEFNEYDGYNRLVSHKKNNVSCIYTYSGDGLRTSKRIGGVTYDYVWDGQDIVAELVDCTLSAKYLRGINLIASEGSDGVRKYYLFNAHGDVTQLADSSGAVSKNYSYDAFGNETGIDSGDANPFRYCGEWWDKETGTVYLRARYYSPGIGRFLSEDSVRGNDSDNLSLNLYTYCKNDPVGMVDPSGHWAEGDEKLSFNAQYDILKLTYQYSKASSDSDKYVIQQQADFVRLCDKANAQNDYFGKEFIEAIDNSAAKNYITMAKLFLKLIGVKETDPTYYSRLGREAMSQERSMSIAMGMCCSISKGAGKVDLNLKPNVSNEKLKNIINDLYKGQGGPNTIGNGTTMDAVRNEIKTGLPTHGKFHTQKLNDYSNALQRRLRAGDLNDYDKSVVNFLIDDINKVLKGQ